jgi:predicted TIM-barrel fold metal-dependent hydrolase
MTALVDRLVAQYRRRRDALELFDLSCWIGKPLEPAFAVVERMDQFKAIQCRCGIRRAVISHTLGLLGGAAEGNRAACDAIADDNSLVAAATLVPELARGDEWTDYLRSLIARRVRVIRLFPAAHNFLLEPDYLHDLLTAVTQLRLPLVVWQTQTTWPAIARVCRAYPELHFIVEGVGRKLFYDNRIYHALLERCPNLWLETHNLVNYLGLDHLVERFGSERWVFGSFFPYLDPNAAAMLLCEGRMSDEDRHNIAHRNLQRLLAEVDAA